MTFTQTPAAPIANINQRAVSLCSAGQFADALPLVMPLLEDSTLPDDERADALKIAGACSFALCRWADAEHFWRQCLYLKPDCADVYSNLGALFISLGRLSAAKSTYRQLLSLRPLDANAHLQLGNVLYGLGHRAEAEAAYRQAVTIRPDCAEAHHNHGIVLRELQRPQEAEVAYRHALRGLHGRAELHNNLGIVLMDLGRLAEADAAYRQALTLKPQYPEALNNLGGVLKATQRFAEAELACRLALAIQPEYAEAHLNLGAVLFDLGRVSEAEAAYREALVHRADYAEAYYNLGVALFKQERFAQAEQAYRDAIRCQPGLARAHNNLGCVLRLLERLPEALDAFREALAVLPNLAEAHANIASALTQLRRFAEAENAYRRAVALKPEYGEARFGLAVLLLGLGRFEEGWPLYECRYEQPNFIHRKTREMLNCPQWSGEPLAGKSVLVWQEDGLGDMLQFGRYIPSLKALGAAHIAFACAPALHRLIAGVDGVDAVLEHHGALAQIAKYDCWTSLLSVPLHLRTTADSIPRPARLRIDPALAEYWRPVLDSLPPGRRIGLVWKGNPKHHNDANRSIPSLATLAPLWGVPGLNFVSLQKGQGEDEARNPPLAQPLLDLGTRVGDFADSAAIVAQLALVICVDTSIAHLAASLGKPCWVMLPERDVDWRWMHERDDSPWYPHTLRLFRRERGEDWASSVERVRQACVERFGGAL
ncbi:tetratricopeptide repeat-containing glycosyltransferase family protein [Paraburkholderia sp. MMS20-SJTN17]|uniref:Tetratricopeptide repeat-containing glycosyltransferase family protein n=1 Tax=Paraburkholderia translucens TaxID=2886945 RepID=A0ABS8K7H7_9BURK|nr:tetratricopeptide repeat-containing glycosyltransferase family protein [Paraburkholderia sp. MMS20-SJTN17]MCC8400674.1 tetratricopeptide repeat-containing glycosyltransferase family protein [Paraburkholderia sp. MMS20-SJTN17]